MDKPQYGSIVSTESYKINLGYLFMDLVRLQERRNLKAFYARKSFYVSIQLYPAALAACFATKVGQDL